MDTTTLWDIYLPFYSSENGGTECLLNKLLGSKIQNQGLK